MVVSNILKIFTPKIGEDEPILTNIFFKWVGSINHLESHLTGKKPYALRQMSHGSFLQ